MEDFITGHTIKLNRQKKKNKDYYGNIFTCLNNVSSSLVLAFCYLINQDTRRFVLICWVSCRRRQMPSMFMKFLFQELLNHLQVGLHTANETQSDFSQRFVRTVTVHHHKSSMRWLSQCISGSCHRGGHVGQERMLPGSLAFIRRATRPVGLYSVSGPSMEGEPKLPGKLWSE